MKCVFFLVHEWHQQKQKELRCSIPPQFRAVPPPSDGEGLWFDTRQPRLSHLNVWIPFDYRRPGARAVLCILLTDSHISIVLIPANIISIEGFISRREKKSNPVSSSHKSLVSSRESNCSEAEFFSATKGFILLLIWWMSSVLRCLCLMSCSNKCHIVEELYYFVRMRMWDEVATASWRKAGIKEARINRWSEPRELKLGVQA